MQRVLIILSEYGYWGEKLIGPKEAGDGSAERAEKIRMAGGERWIKY